MTMLDHTGTPLIDYPESDGSLIAESDWHRDELFDTIHRLRTRYHDRPDVYVSGHMFVYYERGNPSAVFAPDVMVVFGVCAEPRRIYKLWEEGRGPSVVFEVSSRNTWLEDRGNKRAICERLGVDEYYLWDPRFEYLTPPLQGYRLVDGAYQELPPDASGCLSSEALDVYICVADNRLELLDRASGGRLPRPADADAAWQALAEERSARTAADAEVARLRAEIERLRREHDAAG